MDVTFETNQKYWDDIFKHDTIDLSSIRFIDPWAMGLICLKAIEQSSKIETPYLDLPNQSQIIPFLKRMKLNDFLISLNYENKYFENFDVLEMENDSVQEIVHCIYRDEFNARLSSKIRAMLKSFGLKVSDEQKVTSLIGELGNNVFDHNEGAWPTNVGGAILIGQKYDGGLFAKKTLRFIVADPGIGFLGSLKRHKPQPTSHIDALMLGLQGITGRIGEKRGNGLKLIQKWTIKDFSGEVRIQTGDALVKLTKNGAVNQTVKPIQGTIAELVIKYR